MEELLTKEIRTLGDLFFAVTWRPYEDLQRKFHLTEGNRYTWLQISHLLQSHLQNNQKFHLNGIPVQRKQVWQRNALWLLQTTPIKGPRPKLLYQLRWEQYLQVNLTPQHWDSVFTAPKGATRCTNHIELNRKLLFQWHLTPNKIHHINPVYVKNCLRRCNATGTILHMRWECPQVHQFWSSIFEFINLNLVWTIPSKPEIALLNVPPPNINSQQQKLLFHIFTAAAAAMLIARKWKLSTEYALKDLYTLLLTC